MTGKKAVKNCRMWSGRDEQWGTVSNFPENFLLPELVKYGNISIVERNLRGRAAGR